MADLAVAYLEADDLGAAFKVIGDYVASDRRWAPCRESPMLSPISRPAQPAIPSDRRARTGRAVSGAGRRRHEDRHGRE
jgi:hypothetical protein